MQWHVPFEGRIFQKVQILLVSTDATQKTFFCYANLYVCKLSCRQLNKEMAKQGIKLYSSVFDCFKTTRDWFVTLERERCELMLVLYYANNNWKPKISSLKTLDWILWRARRIHHDTKRKHAWIDNFNLFLWISEFLFWW